MVIVRLHLGTKISNCAWVKSEISIPQALLPLYSSLLSLAHVAQAVEDYKEQGVTTTAVPDVALGLTGAMVSYGHTDTLDEEAGSRLRRGDEVLLRVRKFYSVRCTGWAGIDANLWYADIVSSQLCQLNSEIWYGGRIGHAKMLSLGMSRCFFS